MTFPIRQATLEDQVRIRKLYSRVAQESGGLARTPEEVTDSFVSSLIRNCTRNGLILLVEDPRSLEILGLIHAASGELSVLRHVLGELTLLIHPRLQGRGYGKSLFVEFLKRVCSELPRVLRVELRARASNLAALGLYESVGFVREGLFRDRIQTRSGALEDGIPMVWFNPDWESRSNGCPSQIPLGLNEGESALQ